MSEKELRVGDRWRCAAGGEMPGLTAVTEEVGESGWVTVRLAGGPHTMTAHVDELRAYGWERCE